MSRWPDNLFHSPVFPVRPAVYIVHCATALRLSIFPHRNHPAINIAQNRLDGTIHSPIPQMLLLSIKTILGLYGSLWPFTTNGMWIPLAIKHHCAFSLKSTLGLYGFLGSHVWMYRIVWISRILLISRVLWISEIVWIPSAIQWEPCGSL